ncbi:MAG: DEAD/DEAH box helicase, partial [Gaiellaceae bacterium]
MSADLPEIARRVLADARFLEALDAIMVRALSDDLPRIDFELLPARVDWRHALLCASVLTSIDDERTSDAALRVAQASLTDETASAAHRRAAAVVLDRLGNRRAIELWETKEALEAETWTLAPMPLQLDVIRRRIELSVTVGEGERLALNPFQRSFWTEARRRQWLSVSAPTSAGKSYIVRRWFEELSAERAAFRGVYLVPTRALIDEVSRELRLHLAADVEVFVLPWD